MVVVDKKIIIMNYVTFVLVKAIATAEKLLLVLPQFSKKPLLDHSYPTPQISSATQRIFSTSTPTLTEAKKKPVRVETAM